MHFRSQFDLQAPVAAQATDLDLGGMDLQDEGFAPVAAALRSSAVLRCAAPAGESKRRLKLDGYPSAALHNRRLLE